MGMDDWKEVNFLRTVVVYTVTAKSGLKLKEGHKKNLKN
jgi:hypothetical protein